MKAGGGIGSATPLILIFVLDGGECLFHAPTALPSRAPPHGIGYSRSGRQGWSWRFAEKKILLALTGTEP